MKFNDGKVCRTCEGDSYDHNTLGVFHCESCSAIFASPDMWSVIPSELALQIEEEQQSKPVANQDMNTAMPPQQPKTTIPEITGINNDSPDIDTSTHVVQSRAMMAMRGKIPPRPQEPAPNSLAIDQIPKHDMGASIHNQPPSHDMGKSESPHTHDMGATEVFEVDRFCSEGFIAWYENEKGIKVESMSVPQKRQMKYAEKIWKEAKRFAYQQLTIR